MTYSTVGRHRRRGERERRLRVKKENGKVKEERMEWGVRGIERGGNGRGEKSGKGIWRGGVKRKHGKAKKMRILGESLEEGIIGRENMEKGRSTTAGFIVKRDTSLTKERETRSQKTRGWLKEERG